MSALTPEALERLRAAVRLPYYGPHTRVETDDLRALLAERDDLRAANTRYAETLHTVSVAVGEVTDEPDLALAVQQTMAQVAAARKAAEAVEALRDLRNQVTHTPHTAALDLSLLEAVIAKHPEKK